MLVTTKKELMDEIDLKQVGHMDNIIFVQNRFGALYCFENGGADWNGSYFTALEIVDDAEKAKKNPCLILPHGLREKFEDPAFSGKKTEVAEVEIEKLNEDGEIDTCELVGYRESTEGAYMQDPAAVK